MLCIVDYKEAVGKQNKQINKTKSACLGKGEKKPDRSVKSAV